MDRVDPQAYLRDVLAKIVARHPMSRIDELLPFAYPIFLYSPPKSTILGGRGGKKLSRINGALSGIVCSVDQVSFHRF